MKWIDVKDDLPNDDGYYLVLFENLKYKVCRFISEQEFWYTDSDIWQSPEVTHWMEIDRSPQRT